MAGDAQSVARVTGDVGDGEGPAGTDTAKMLDPLLIMQIGTGFCPSKTLLSAVELGLFTTLGSSELTGPAIAERLELRSRAVFDYTGADFRGWCTDAGFQSVEVLPLAGPASAGIAYK